MLLDIDLAMIFWMLTYKNNSKNKWMEGIPGAASGKELVCQCRRCKRWGFNPWVGKIPWRRAWQPTPVFLPGEFHGKKNSGRGAWQATVHKDANSWTWLKWLSTAWYKLKSFWTVKKILKRERKKRQSMGIGENICKPYIQQEVNNTKHIKNLYNSTAKNHPNKRWSEQHFSKDTHTQQIIQ